MFRSFILLFIYLFLHLFNFSFVYSFMNSCIFSFIHLFSHLLISLFDRQLFSYTYTNLHIIRTAAFQSIHSYKYRPRLYRPIGVVSSSRAQSFGVSVMYMYRSLAKVQAHHAYDYHSQVNASTKIVWSPYSQ